MIDENRDQYIKIIYILELQGYFRTFYGFSSNKYPKERVVNAVLSDIVTLILKVVNSYHPCYLLAVAHDLDAYKKEGNFSQPYFGSHGFREIYTAAISILQSLKVPTIKIHPDQYNATVATQYLTTLSLGASGVFISNDKLFYQLISDRSVVVDPYNNRTIDAAAVKERFRVSPQFVPDIFALTGSIEHNIRGVVSIGEKSAIDLISKYGSLENLLQNKHLIPKYGEKLALYENEAIESKNLATLSTLAVGTKSLFHLDELQFYPDNQGFQQTLEFYGLVKLLSEKFHGRSSYYSSSKLAAVAELTTWPVFERLDLKRTVTSNIINKYGIDNASTDPVKTAYIYALVDPRDAEKFKYVGKTVDPKIRLKDHINRACKRLTPKDEWLCQLQADGITPQLIILEILNFRYECEWGDREIYFIKYYFDQGFNLLNSLPGGPALSLSNPNGGESQYTWKQCMLDRLKLWLESPTHERSVKVWEAQIALSVQMAREHGGSICKYCGVYLPINSTPLHSLPFTDILPFPPVSDKTLWPKEQERHVEGCKWWKRNPGRGRKADGMLVSNVTC